MRNLMLNMLGATVILIGAMTNAHASNFAELQVQISGAQKDKYYVCVSGVGCLQIDSSKKSIPIDAMNVRYIFLANSSTYQMYPQNLPESCNVSVAGNQKIVVKGNFAKSANNKVYIANLHCSVIS